MCLTQVMDTPDGQEIRQEETKGAFVVLHRAGVMKRSLTDLGKKRAPSRGGFADSILSRVTSKAWENDADIEDSEAVERTRKVRPPTQHSRFSSIACLPCLAIVVCGVPTIDSLP